MKIENKSTVIVAVVTILILLIGVYFLFLSKKTNKTSDNPEETPTEVLIPTVDSSVKVDLTGQSGKEVLLEIDKIPTGTSTIEYSLSYETKQQGLQGVMSLPISLNNETKYKKKITLGTCSSGACVYHEVIGAIKLSLKFSGDYGERIFEKDFTL